MRFAYLGDSVSSPSVTINSGAVATHSRQVTLQISANGTPGYMKIGDSSDLSGVVAVPYQSEIEYTLPGNNGSKKVYVEIINFLRQASANDSIKYAALDAHIVATTGPGETSQLRVYDTHGNPEGNLISNLFPASYKGGAGVVAIDSKNTGMKQQVAVFALSDGGPQVRILGLKANGEVFFLTLNFDESEALIKKLLNSSSHRLSMLIFIDN